MILDVLEERKCGALVEHMPNEQGSSGLLFIVKDVADGAGIIPRDTSFDSCQGQIRSSRVRRYLVALGFDEQRVVVGERHVEVDAR